ncbi:MAG: NADH-quinone oxidoreductase subunit N [Terracidiphilus sp.]|jgi:NADH-quinone oxidoreductase subunit N
MSYVDLFRATLPETALEIAALLVLVVDLGFLRKAAAKTRVAAAAVLGVVGCAAAIWAVYASGRNGFRAGSDLLLFAWGPAPVAQIAILVLTALTLLLLIDSEFTRNPGEYVSVVLMAAAGGLIISAAQDLLIIFVGLELLSLGLYILTAFAKKSEKSAEAAIKYYLFGGMSAAFLLFGFSYFYGLTGTTSLVGIQTAILQSGPTPLFYIAWILVVAGLGFKVAAVPFHLWAPDTYEGAPAPAAAFIASVSKVASFALLLTIFGGTFFEVPVRGNTESEIDHLFSQYMGSWTHVIGVMLIVAVASMVVGNLAALAQTSVRRLLAYSAIAHAGYILLGVCPLQHSNPLPFSQQQLVGIERVVQALISRQSPVLYYILTYGLTTIGAFGVVGVVERTTGSDKLDAFLGLNKRNPMLAAVLLVLFLSLAGIPPLVGFWAKFNLFAAVLAIGAGPIPFALVALAIAFSAVSLYYYLQVLKRAYVMPAADGSPIRAHPVTMVVLLLIAAAVVVMGCFPALLQNWIASFYG